MSSLTLHRCGGCFRFPEAGHEPGCELSVACPVCKQPEGRWCWAPSLSSRTHFERRHVAREVRVDAAQREEGMEGTSEATV